MTRHISASRHDWEYWYSIVALLFLSNALHPFLSELIGIKIETYGDSNPLNLLVSIILYLIAGLLILKSPGNTLKLLQQNPFTVALLLLPLVSEFWSVDPGTTFRRAAAYTLTGVFCVYIAGRLTPEQFLKRLMFIVLIGGVASLLYAVVMPQFAITPGGMNAGTWRGVYGQKNDLGRISTIALICAYYFRPANRTETFYRYLTTIIFLFLLVASQSRTSWLIVVAFYVGVPLLRVMRDKRLTLSLRLFIAFSCAVTLGLVALASSEEILAALGRDDTFSGRETLWRAVTTIVNERFPVLGAGYGAFFTNNGGGQDLDAYIGYWVGRPDQAHSGYLNVRADLGAVGLVVLLVFLAITSAQLIRLILSRPNQSVWPAFGGLMVFFLINNYTETVAFKHSDISWAIVVIMAFYAGSQRQKAVHPVKLTPKDIRYRKLALRPISIAPIHGSISTDS
ncbi:MAG TPA: O-antigen ligase family protein [Micropepsaceae bacterium]|jgi:hypothetical protein|nr:O-antigen ligase family protein [Micropepsaceae bacterium]